jgi:hypothetical protein
MSLASGREVGHVVPGGLGHGTPFFLSYSRAAEGTSKPGAEFDPDQLVERFFRDLSVNVKELLGPRVGAEPGFMDRNMRGGTQWNEELLRALGTCQILVALLSPGYLGSEWCGMEWDAFAKREVRRSSEIASPHQGCIIPVIWVPVGPETGLPPPIRTGMLFAPESKPEPDVVSQYRENGIFGLLRMRQDISYQIVAWQLAMHIARVYRGQQVEEREFRPEDLRNVFGGGTGE